MLQVRDNQREDMGRKGENWLFSNSLTSLKCGFKKQCISARMGKVFPPYSHIRPFLLNVRMKVSDSTFHHRWSMKSLPNCGPNITGNDFDFLVSPSSSMLVPTCVRWYFQPVLSLVNSVMHWNTTTEKKKKKYNFNTDNEENNTHPKSQDILTRVDRPLSKLKHHS